MHQAGMVTIEGEGGIGDLADLLRLSPDRRTHRRRRFLTSFAQTLGGGADAAKRRRADDWSVR
jgi:hypothetical protein